MKKIIISWLIIVWTMTSCKTVKIDHATGDLNPTKNTVHLNNVHKGRPWKAGKSLIIPAGFKPYPMKTTVKNEKHDKSN